MLCAGPQAGSSPSFREVIGFQSPISPAQTSGGFTNDCRITAVVTPSFATDIPAPNQPEEIVSTSVQTTLIVCAVKSSSATPVRPSTYTVIKICRPPLIQVIELGVALIFGVISRGSPPAAGKT